MRAEVSPSCRDFRQWRLSAAETEKREEGRGRYRASRLEALCRLNGDDLRSLPGEAQCQIGHAVQRQRQRDEEPRRRRPQAAGFNQKEREKDDAEVPQEALSEMRGQIGCRRWNGFPSGRGSRGLFGEHRPCSWSGLGHQCWNFDHINQQSLKIRLSSHLFHIARLATSALAVRQVALRETE